MEQYNIYRIIGAALIGVAMLTSCEFNEQLTGNGEVTTHRKSVQPFNEINIDGVLNVYLYQSSVNKVEVRTDENLHNLVEVETSNNALYVKTRSDKEYEATQMDVHIYSPDYTGIELRGVSALYCKDTLSLNSINIEKENTGFMLFKAVLNHLSIETIGIGDMELQGKAINTVVTNSMIGDVLAYGFKTKDMDFSHSGTGKVEINVTNYLNIEISGTGDVYCKGNPKTIKKTVTGVGRVYIEE